MTTQATVQVTLGDISSDFSCLTMKSGHIIDFREPLKYPLFPIPLSLCFPGSTIRSTVKSTILKLISYTQTSEAYVYVYVGAYILDLMAII